MESDADEACVSTFASLSFEGLVSSDNQWFSKIYREYMTG